MGTKAGTVIRKVRLKDGEEAILRCPRWEDVDGLMAFINELVEEEGINISVERKVTRDEELDWLARQLAEMERGEIVACVAEVDGRIVANSWIAKGKGVQSHVGTLGISVLKGFRNRGLGSTMVEALLKEAKAVGIKVVKLSVFASNPLAIHVYEKAGFRKVGCIPGAFYKWGRYIDEIIMVKELP